MYDRYVSPLSERYASKEMQYIFSPDKKFRTWRRLWIALAETEKELGLPITQEQIDELKAHKDEINFDVAKDGMNFILANLLELKNIKSINNEIDNNSFLRIGETNKVSLEEFAAFVKKKFNEKYVRVIGDETRKVRKVAVVGGAGSSFVLQAKKLGCDVIVTGEIHHNNAIDALEWNMVVVEVSHSVEGLYKETVLSDLSKNFESVEFVLSCTDNNPFKWI